MPSSAITIVHKYIRRELFEVSRRLSTAGPDDIRRIRTALDEVTQLLHGHATHEGASFEPLLARANPEYAERMSQDHRRLDALLDAINANAQRDELTADDMLQLHLDWNRFVGQYLAHLDDEERTLFPVLGLDLPPVEQVARSAATMQPAMQRSFLNKLWAVVTPEERAALERALAATQQPGEA